MIIIFLIISNLIGVIFGYTLCLNHLESGKLKQMKRKVRNKIKPRVCQK